MKESSLKKMSLTTETKKIFGIDLGTTNSAIALRTASTVPTLIPLGKKTTLPSCVMWENGQFIVGEEAYAKRYQSNVIYSVKRLMGSNKTITLVDGEKSISLTPAEVSSHILTELCKRASVYYDNVKDVVITVPAYFNQKQIEDTLKAGELAGLTIHHILKEPTSAGYVYSNIDSAESGEQVIYDLGGGTFDVTHSVLIRKTPEVQQTTNYLESYYDIKINTEDSDKSDKYYSRVLGTYGDMHLGGDDIDTALANRLLSKEGITKQDIGEEDFEKLVLECEKFKKSDIFGFEFTIAGKTFHMNQELLKEATREIYEKTLTIMQPLLSNIKSNNIKSIILVGGSTKSKYIREWLASEFPMATVVCSLNPDETVAQGAASVGYDIAGGIPFKFQDVLPLAIGVLVDETTISTCLPTNTSIPYSTSKVYTTLYDNQQVLEVKLYQGLSTNPNDCTFLGTIRIENLPPAPKGELDIVIDFILAVNGRLRVQATIGDLTKDIEIENIFSVKNAEQEKDTFKDTFLSLAISTNNEKVIQLFEKREKASEEEKEEIESEILMAL